MTARLASQTQKSIGPGNGMRTATIAAVSGSVVTIALSGGQISSGVGVLGSYEPAVGDTVAVFRQDSSWLILGAISPGITGKGQVTGTASVSFAAVATNFVAVSFGVTFSTPPVVMTNIDSGAGVTALWCSRATTVTTTDFLLYCFSSDGGTDTWSNIAVSWVATAR